MDTIKQEIQWWKDANRIDKIRRGFMYANAFFVAVEFTIFLIVVGALGASWTIVIFLYADLTINTMGLLGCGNRKILIAYLILHLGVLLLLYGYDMYYVYECFADKNSGNTHFLLTIPVFTGIFSALWVVYTLVSVCTLCTQVIDF